jgi:N-acetylglucosaminyl-diphospho-decaprenol L-rhamnosyltransferase
VPLVDVVIVSYNSQNCLRACVEPLNSVADVQVVVVDSASSDGTLEGIADLDVATVPLRHNRGFAHACNVGWRMGTSPYVLFLNPDARIGPDSVATMVAAAEADSSVGAVAPRIVGPDGSIDFSLFRFLRLRSTYAQALFLHRLFPRAAWLDEVRDLDAYCHAWTPEWVSGACLLVRRPVLEQVSGLDERFFLYCEDLDLCRRIREAGFEILFEPRALAVHLGGASKPRFTLLPVLAASRVRYARKHERRHVVIVERLGIALGALTHMIATRGGFSARAGYARALIRAISPDPRPSE